VKKTSQKFQNLDIKDESEVWELGVPFHKVNLKMNISSNKSIKRVLLTEQTSCLLLCKEIVTCTTSTISELKTLPPQLKILVMYLIVMVIQD